MLGLVAVAVPARFIGEHCFSVRTQPSERSPEIVRATADMSGYLRNGSATFLTLPEWYVVYSAEEYAAFVKSRAPSRFPYFAAIGQYWRYYSAACRATKRVYAFDASTHLILALTGLGFSVDNTIKGSYENTVGVVTEGIGLYHTEEDVFARRRARSHLRRRPDPQDQVGGRPVLDRHDPTPRSLHADRDRAGEAGRAVP